MTYQPSVRAQVIARRTYSRPTNEAGTTFETWREIIDRVCGHQQWLWERATGDKPLTREAIDELAALKALMVERKSLVSGRTLWMGGTDISKRRESSQFNCSFLRIVTIHDVVDAFWLLLQGCGVGFEPVMGTLNGFTKPAEVEVIRSTRDQMITKRGKDFNTDSINDGVWRLTVGDSAEAWAKAAGKVMAQKEPFHKIILDFSQIRPAGFRLKGYGWISSGDETFSKAMIAICEIMSRKAGQLLDRIDILDVMNHLGTTLSSRRSAEIALVPFGDPQWREFATAKKDHFSNGNAHRSMSNNSLLFYSRPNKGDLRNLFQMMMDAGGSEPGFINAESAINRAPWFKGVNPCGEILLGDKGFCVAHDTPLITEQALLPIGELVGKYVKVWNGKRWSEVVVRQTTAASKLLRVRFSDGTYLDCTEYHGFSVKNRFEDKWRRVETKDLAAEHYTISTESFKIENSGGLSVPNAYTIGVMYGDGNSNELMLYGEAKIALPVDGVRHNTKFRQNPDVRQQRVKVDFNIDDFDILEAFAWDRASALQFIAGIADTDGSNTDSGGIRIYQSDELFIRNLHLLLVKNGIRSSVNKMAEAGQMTNFGERGKAIWYVQITECQEIPCNRLDVSRGHKPEGKAKHQTIKSIEELPGLHPTYCFTESEFGMAVFNATLTYQCNLCETDLGKFNGNMQGLLDAIYLIARANYRQTCVNLHDGVLQATWHELNEFLRLCGVGLTGIVAWEGRNDPKAWQRLRNAAITGVNSMADELHLPRPKATTTLKPSGTASKIMDAPGEGLHRPLGEFIFNNVRFSANDPLVSMLEGAGYHVFPDPYAAVDVLIRFPVHNDGVEFDTDDRGKKVNRESALDQLNRYKIVMDHYVDHNASITVSYVPEEVTDIVAWIHKNWDTYVGVSFLYRNDASKTAEDLGYPYLPQQVVTEEDFNAYTAGLLPITVDKVKVSSKKTVELDFEVDAGSECAGGVCPIK